MEGGVGDGDIWRGSTSFISEYAPDEKRDFFASISATFTTLPSLLGGLTVFAVSAPAVFLLPETRRFDLLRGADKAHPAESAHPTAT